jgi:phenylacetate-CoA ligase
LLTEVSRQNRFYQKKFADVGCSAVPASLTDFSARFPFTSKAELVADQQDNPPYGSNLTYPHSAYTRLHQTSGTSGSPLRWLDTPESWSAMTDDWATVLKAASVTAGDRVFFAFSFGPFLGFWLAFEAAQRLGCLCIPGGGMRSALRVRVLLENGCTVLCCTPSYALHLAEAAREEGVDLRESKIRLIVVAGEPGGSVLPVRERLCAAWNDARVFDHHGMTEVGPVTFELPNHPGNLAILEQSFFAEIVDPKTGLPVSHGEVGELVLTTLKRIASPLIRYRTGDLVRWGTHLHGSTPVLGGGILGRVDDMVVVRGVNVYPSAVDQLIHSLPSIAEYRVTVDSRSPLVELSVEVEAGPETALACEQLLGRSLGLRIPVTPVAPGILPRFEHKARRWNRLG